MFSRFIILPLDRVFLPSEQDKDLTEKVLADMPGVLAWAIAGARRLLENGGLFTAITASSPVLDEWEAEVNPMRDFIREWMVKSEYDFTSLQLITEQLRRQTDRKVTTRTVGRWCREAGLTVETKHVKGDGRKVKAVVGYRLETNPGSLGMAAFEEPPVPDGIEQI